MPCDVTYDINMTAEEREEQIAETLTDLQVKLSKGSIQIEIGPQGAVAFANWNATDRNGIADVCAFRRLTNQNSWALRQAIAAAEFRTGRQVSTTAVAAGTHSHDGGATWAKGHR